MAKARISTEEASHIINLYDSGAKVDAIKGMRSITKLGLKEARISVEELASNESLAFIVVEDSCTLSDLMDALTRVADITENLRSRGLI